MKHILVIILTFLSLNVFAQLPSVKPGSVEFRYPNTGNAIDTFATKADVRAGGGTGATLYSTTGSNTNGAMTQNAVTNALGAKLDTMGMVDFDPTTKVNISDTSAMLSAYLPLSGGTLSNNLKIVATNPSITIQYPSSRFLQLLAGASGTAFNFDKSGYFAIYGATSTSDGGTVATNYYKVFGATGNTLIGNNSYNTPDSNWKVDITSSGTSGTLRVFDNKVSTGITKVSFREGAGQGASDIFNIYSNDGATKKFSLNGGNVTATQYSLSNLNTAPASATATGTFGEIRITSGYIYVCTATNTWVRTALTTW
jgi:hypothetical protein